MPISAYCNASAPSCSHRRCHVLAKATPCQRRWAAMQRCRLCAKATGVPPAARAPKEPLEARLLSSFLKLSSVPYSSYISQPRTALHDVEPFIKQAWLLVLFVLATRASPSSRLALSVLVLGVTVLALPKSVWRPQLRGVGSLAAFIFAMTAIAADGVPPVLQARSPMPGVDGFPPLQPACGGYRYVLFHLWFITVTRRSVALAIGSASLTLITLQSASLCLTTTPAEGLAAALQQWLAPLRLVGVNVKEVGLTLLLSLRFLALVFEEARNLALGLAARNILWTELGPGGGVQVILRVMGRLFANLMQRSEDIASAIVARNFAGPDQHRVYLSHPRKSSLAANITAVLLLLAVAFAVVRCS